MNPNEVIPREVQRASAAFRFSSRFGGITELQDRMAALRGEVPIQMRFYLPPPKN